MFKMMENIPNQVGALLLNEEGAVIESSGELENDERCALVIMELLSLAPSLDPKAFPVEQGFRKLSVVYDDHCYVICLSNRRIHIVKRNVTIDTEELSETN